MAPLVGHAGDGNFHLIIMLDPDDRAEFDTISRLSERLVERALKFGGTCSGEHGVGIGKLKYLDAEHGAALDVMRAIKRAIDPNNLMNPGKLIPSNKHDHGQTKVRALPFRSSGSRRQRRTTPTTDARWHHRRHRRRHLERHAA